MTNYLTTEAGNRRYALIQTSPADKICDAVATYLSEPNDMMLIEVQNAWNANVKAVEIETLDKIVA